MELPKCCGKVMKKIVETGTYIEVECNVCGDTVFIKKEETKKPELIDD